MKVWQKSMDLVVRCYQLTSKFPKTEIEGLSSQIQRAAVSIPSNIADYKASFPEWGSSWSDDTVVTDDDTFEEYTGDNGGLYPYDPIKADIDIRENPYTVFELKRRCDQKKLILDPEFQRNPNVWTKEQKSKFIESIFLNFPLPYWYVKQTKDGKYILSDGID